MFRSDINRGLNNLNVRPIYKIIKLFLLAFKSLILKFVYDANCLKNDIDNKDNFPSILIDFFLIHIAHYQIFNIVIDIFTVKRKGAIETMYIFSPLA